MSSPSCCAVHKGCVRAPLRCGKGQQEICILGFFFSDSSFSLFLHLTDQPGLWNVPEMEWDGFRVLPTQTILGFYDSGWSKPFPGVKDKNSEYQGLTGVGEPLPAPLGAVISIFIHPFVPSAIRIGNIYGFISQNLNYFRGEGRVHTLELFSPFHHQHFMESWCPHMGNH